MTLADTYWSIYTGLEISGTSVFATRVTFCPSVTFWY